VPFGTGAAIVAGLLVLLATARGEALGTGLPALIGGAHHP
jgi:hypothetical protein